MELVFEAAEYEPFCVVMKGTSRVSQVKATLSDWLNLDPDKFRIQHKNKFLSDDSRSLEEYGLREAKEKLLVLFVDVCSF